MSPGPSAITAFLRLAAERPAQTGSLKVAAVVGTILNVINQGDRLVTMGFDELNWWKLCLTFLVPYCVSVYAATRIRMIFAPGLIAYRNARLRCRRCGRQEQAVLEGSLVPQCPECRDSTSWKAVGP